jgi:hypothetical protein
MDSRRRKASWRVAAHIISFSLVKNDSRRFSQNRA